MFYARNRLGYVSPNIINPQAHVDGSYENLNIYDKCHLQYICFLILFPYLKKMFIKLHVSLIMASRMCIIDFEYIKSLLQ